MQNQNAANHSPTEDTKPSNPRRTSGYRYYSVITGLFAASLVISNILDAKIFSLFSLSLPGGIILFPIVYVFGDVLTEVYGYSNSRKVIWVGFISLFLLSVSSLIVEHLPAAGFWGLQKEYEAILGKVPRIVLASITAFFLGEFTNSLVIAKLKIRSQGHGMGTRFVLSTLFGQLVDTSVFVMVAFLGVFGAKDLLLTILSGWAFKVAWEILVLPITLRVVSWLKREEQEDYYDYGTNFNPFKLS